MTVDEYLKEFTLIKSFKNTGQKKVSLAKPNRGGEPVIIKIGKSPSQHLFKRAKREVEVQRSLKSSYYPKNFDFILFEGNRFVIVEEYIESQALSDCFDIFRGPRDILILLKHLICGLDLIWKSKVTHRDLKPDNILIKPDKTPVIIDLGIVLAEEKSTLTLPFSRSPCTPNYAAPEQLKNRRAEIDHRTDQFILGIDILQLIEEGKHPFSPSYVGFGANIPENILNGNLIKNRLNDSKFVKMKALVSRLLAPEPYKRFRNTNLLKEEIAIVLGAYDEV
ncbi:MAG: protein kinase [Deltaproteobacteria bacterium]|nr:protein kinase [Deltaproteobacteria bacterium]MBL7224678.1 protein kinase [Desulfobacteraceae bacterium]